MSVEGLLPRRPDRVVFADTKVEPLAIYEAVLQDMNYAQSHGIPFDVVTGGDLRERPSGGVEIPAFTAGLDGKSRGMLRRQCTGKYKIQPIRRHLRSLGLKSVVSWIGITTDEADRMKPSDVRWVVNEWPLIEAGLSREDCAAFLRARGLAVVKSACVFCPYQGAASWARVRRTPVDWARAVEYDQTIRDERPVAGQVFVHRDRVPLAEASVPDLGTMTPLFDPEDMFSDECAGACGV